MSSRGIGDDLHRQAFEFARAADPGAELYHDDDHLATRPANRAGAIRIIKELQQRGLRIDAVGEQGPWRLRSWPTARRNAEERQPNATAI